MSAYSPDRDSQFNLRFGVVLHRRLKDSAKTGGRSLNAEINHRLEKSFENHSSLAPEIARVIEDLVNQRVSKRLAEVARQIGGDHGK